LYLSINNDAIDLPLPLEVLWFTSLSLSVCSMLLLFICL